MPRTVVGVAGKIGAGKDVVADYLVREHGFVKVRFSDALKAELCERLPRTLSAIAELHWKAGTRNFGRAYSMLPESERLAALVYALKPSGVRELLQEYGTDVRRQDDPDYWTNKWVRTVTELGPDARVVAPDMRFENEATAIGSFGGALAVVRRPGLARVDTHVSESFVDFWTAWDVILENDSTVEQLERRVFAWVSSGALTRGR